MPVFTPATVTFLASPKLSEPLGIFGGTFDPVHFGHLRLAEEAIQHLGLAGVRWIPAGQPPHRATPQVTSAHRLAMVLRSTADNPRFSVDAAEVEAARASYTIDTLTRLRAFFGPAQPIVLLVGADAFAGLPSWHRWEEILTLAHIGVSHRPGFPIDAAQLPSVLAELYAARRSLTPDALRHSPAGRIVTFAMTQLDISATQIRKCLNNQTSARYLLPDSVLDYIHTHQLYRSC